MYEQELEILQGAISAIVFQNPENGYAVLRMACLDGQTVTVVGTVPMPVIGERLMVTGKWGSHSSYGRQFEAEFLERMMPSSEKEILQYLSGHTVKGIGPKLAARIVQRFGAETLNIIEHHPERLAEISGISENRAQAIGESFRLQFGIRQLLEFFSLHQLPAELAVKVYKQYGEDSVDAITQDPYILMDDGMEAPFGAVDRFAINLGMDGDDPRRVSAGILYELRCNLTAGHVFLPEEKLLQVSCQLLTIDQQTAIDALEKLHEHGQLVRDELANVHIIYLPRLYEAETYCAQRLRSAATKRFPAPPRLNAMLRTAAKESGLAYAPQQEEAIARSATSGLLLITGGPGTGKTTIVNGILSLFDQMGVKCALAAPTGRAAKRMTEVTGRDASTIHRLLEATIDPHTGDLYFNKNEADPLKVQAVVVDEMSMVDISLLHCLLRAIPENARIIMVGDPDQLPPVGPGSPFSDMLRSGLLPSVRLTEIFRQAQQSLIVMNAHRVNQGEMPELRDVKNDFFFLPARTEEQLAQTIVGLCSTRLPQRMGIPADQIQVLSPTKKGAAGTTELNRLLQHSLNPPAPDKKERKYGQTIFREGDRVMQIRNNYDMVWQKDDGSVGTGVFNGDVGIIATIDPDLEILTVRFDDRVADYEFSQLNELELAFAMTVHKSQGSEYRAVILAAWNGSPYLLSRSILYTAITRARELMIIAGLEQTVYTMTENAKSGRRYTGLKLRLQNKK